MELADILTQLGEGLASFVPSFGKAIWQLFLNMFLTYTETEGAVTVTGFNTLGILSLVSVIVGLTYKIVPIVANWISRKVKSRRRRAKA